MALRSLAVHAGILALSAIVAVQAWTKDDEGDETHEAELWDGKLDQVERVEFVSPSRTVLLEAKKDDIGRYWEGSVERQSSAPGRDPHGDPHADPHAPPKPQEGGANERVKDRFVSVVQGNEFIEKLVPLRAKRSLGILDPARYEEFGFEKDKPQVLKLRVGGAARELVVGGSTPGGGDTYVRFGETGQTYVLASNITTDLQSAESRLIQRDLHVFDSAEVAKVKVTAGEASRELVALPGKAGTWAFASDATKKDETATNWMSNFERLRVTQYSEGLQPSVVLRVDFYDLKAKPLGFVELGSLPADGEAKPQYYGRSETSRWWGRVVNTTAEQSTTDLSTLLKP